MVEHILSEIALPAVGARDRIAALDIAVLAAGDVFGRTGGIATGAADGIVVIVQRRNRRLVARCAGGENTSEQDSAGETRRDDLVHQDSFPPSRWLNARQVQEPNYGFSKTGSRPVPRSVPMSCASVRRVI